MNDETSTVIPLTKERELELKSKQATQLDIHHVRENQHRLANKVAAFIGHVNSGMDDIKTELKDLQNKVQEQKYPLVNWKNGTEEKITIQEAMERTINNVIEIGNRTMLLKDIQEFIESHKKISKIVKKRTYPILKFLAVLGFALFLLFCIAAWVTGKISLSELLEKIFS